MTFFSDDRSLEGLLLTPKTNNPLLSNVLNRRGWNRSGTDKNLSAGKNMYAEFLA